jgi:predicted dehydrogenase
MTSLWDAQIVDYLPPRPDAYRPGIGLVGCGAISRVMLAAYRRAGFEVVALCDHSRAAAEARRAEFYPRAQVFTDYRALLEQPAVEVVDIATHTDVRPPIVEDCLRAGRHVLSQKPFVEDLALGERLCDVADEHGVRLAANQNARWAPHFSYLRSAVRTGLLGDLTSADFAVHWAHDRYVQGTRFAEMPDLVLLDFGVHWFDIVHTLFADGEPARRIFAAVGSSAGQAIPVPTQAQVAVELPDAQVSLVFRAASAVAEQGRYRVTGTRGIVTSAGPALGGNEVEVTTLAGSVAVPLAGHWFVNGFQGAMGELLRAVEAGERPDNDARTALGGLRLCFAAIASARAGVPIDPASVTALEPLDRV